MQEYDGKKQVKHIKLKEDALWVRIYDLLLMVRNIYIGELIVNTLGCFEEVDLEPDKYDWDEYMRVRIMLDIMKPLLRKKKFMIEGLDLMWISFTYEQLQDFCYWYRMIGHNHKDYAQ